MGCEWLLEAAVIAERVVEVWTEAVSTKHLRTLVAIQTLAATYQKQGREGEASHLEAQVEELRRDVDFGFEREKEKRSSISSSTQCWSFRSVERFIAGQEQLSI
jgi:hypothetical protein